MIRLPHIFWTIAAIDAALLVILLIITLQDRAGTHDGGRAMGIFFFIVVPGVALVLAMLMFHLTSSPIPRSIAQAVILVPAIWFVKLRIEDRLIDRQVEAHRLGVGYFESATMRALGAAVVRRDVETLLRVGRGVDVNTPGRDMTLMRLAVDRPDARTSDGSELPVVRALLSLGARTDDAMPAACTRSDSALLSLLLAAGGNPNLMVHGHEPLVFEVMSSITPQNFRLLATHGLILDSRSHGDPLPVQLAIYRRWDLLAIAIELGADMAPARPDGRTVASELTSQLNEETTAGREIPADLLRARTALQAGASTP